MLMRRSYLMRRRSEYEALADEAKAEIQALLDQVTARHEEVVSPLDREVELIDARLSLWLRRHVAAGGAPNVVLPWGKLTLNPLGAGKTVPTDAEALLAWAEEHAPAAVTRPAPTVDLAKLKKATNLAKGTEPNSVAKLYDANGEEVPGVEIHIGDRTWKVTHA